MEKTIEINPSMIFFKVGDEIELLSEEEIESNEKEYRFSRFSETLYDGFRKNAPLKILNVKPERINARVVGAVIGVEDSKGKKESFFYPLEIKEKCPFAVDLI